MNATLRLFLDLCLLRAGPERMPTLGIFVLLVVAANLLVSALVALTSPFNQTLMAAVTVPVLGAAILASGTWLVLLAKGRQARFTATFTALMGADAFITALSWPLVMLMTPGGEPNGLDLAIAVAQFAMLFWWITVAGYVFASALEVPRSQGVAVALFVVLATLLVNASLFPPPAVEAAAAATNPPASRVWMETEASS